MMIFRIVLILLVAGIKLVNAEIQDISLDCDVEFAETATKLASEYVGDPAIIEYIHAVMSSCNKAPIQKMAESSVFLLHKGTVTPKVMGEIRLAFDQIRKRKEGEIAKKISKLPPELYSTAQKIRAISSSGGLSGNEKKEQIEYALKMVPSSYQYQLLQVFDEKPPKMDGEPLKKPDIPIEISTPASFAIPKQNLESPPEMRNSFEQSNFNRGPESDMSPEVVIPKDSLVIPRVNMPFQQMEKEIRINPQQITGSKQNVLFPDLPPSQPIQATVNNQGSPFRGIFDNPRFDNFLNSIVQKGAKIAEIPLPKTVGTVDHSKMKPSDLQHFLNPANWPEAAKFLAKNDLPTALSQFIEQNSQNIPQVFSPLQFGTPIRQSPIKIHSDPVETDAHFLPSRRQNDGALDSYDTHTDRFASTGPINRIKIDGDFANLKMIPANFNKQSISIGNSGNSNPAQISSISPIKPKTVDTIAGAMPTMPPINGYGTYAPAPTAIVPNVLQRQAQTPDQITGSYRQPISPVYNQRLPNGQMRNVKIDVTNEQ